MSSSFTTPKPPYQSLEESLTALVKCLSLFVPFRVWMVTRIHGSDWNVLLAEDDCNEITPGTVFHWSNSYCSRMVEGQGPCFAPDAQAIPSYAAAAINEVMAIGAYIGQPLIGTDGSLLGTLCAVDSQRKEEFTASQEFLVETITRTMSGLISTELSLEQARQDEVKLRYLAERDSLTGLANRHCWETAVIEEEIALSKLGENAMVMIIDLDGLKKTNDTKGHAFGDQYLITAARTLRTWLRDIDIVARLGGDEFGVIIRNITKEEALEKYKRVQATLRDAGIEASVGHAMRLSCRTLQEAVTAADARMYKNKLQRKGSKKLGA